MKKCTFSLFAVGLLLSANVFANSDKTQQEVVIQPQTAVEANSLEEKKQIAAEDKEEQKALSDAEESNKEAKEKRLA